MLKKLVFIVCFTFWLVPKVSAQQDFLNAMRITSVFYDLNYDFNYIFRHYLSDDIKVSFMDSITIYKWDSLQENYSETKRLRFKYADTRRCYSAEVIDLTTNTVTKKAIIEMHGGRSIQLHLYKSTYSTSYPYYTATYDFNTYFTTFYQRRGFVEHHTNYQKNETWMVFNGEWVELFGASGIKDWFKDSISKSTYHHSEEYATQSDGNFYERQFYAIRDFDNQSISRIHGTDSEYPLSTDYTAIDSNTKTSYSISFDSDRFWLLGDSIKKEFRNDDAYHLTDNYLKTNENWEYQYTDTNQIGYLYRRRYCYFQQKDKPSVLDIFNTETHEMEPYKKNSPFYYAGATILPTQLLNNFIAEELDSLSPQYSIHKPIDFASPSRIMHCLAGVNVRYFGKTIDFPRDKEFDDNERKIIAEYKVVMHYTNIGSLAGNNKVLKSSGISVYPNPVNNLLFVELPNTQAGILEILNLNGVVVASQNTSNFRTQINVEHLSPALYVIRLITADGNITSTKFIKQ